MKISIITVSFNSAKYIKQTIESVLNQSYPFIEYIIVDGSSTDGTIGIIKSFEGKIQKLVSEPDNGIYDAMNKGINMATGDIIAFLNSDDFYIDSSVISSVINVFEDHNPDVLFADLFYVKREDVKKVIRKWSTGPYVFGAFNMGWHPAHPTFITKREIYFQYGLFDLSFRLASDFEIMLRFLEKNKIKSYYLAKPLINMRLGGATSKSLSNIVKQNIECYKAFKKNDLNVSIFYPFLRLVPKINQFLKK